MKGYIHSCMSISALDSCPDGILSSWNSDRNKELKMPDQAADIPAALLRRMSRITQIAAGTGLLTKGKEEVNGIIVGTGLGDNENIVKFLKGCLGQEGGLTSPGTFVQSTHNSIAGQIALLIQNHGYNMTYTHRGLSFESALTDGLLLSTEEKGKVLIGGVDIRTELLKLLEKERTIEIQWLGEGSSFFLLSSEKENAMACINECKLLFEKKDSPQKVIMEFLSKEGKQRPDLILYGNSCFNEYVPGPEMNGVPLCNYSEVSGVYYTNSGFGLQLAAEILSMPEKAAKKGFLAENILIINNFNDSMFGMTSLSKA